MILNFIFSNILFSGYPDKALTVEVKQPYSPRSEVWDSDDRFVYDYKYIHRYGYTHKHKPKETYVYKYTYVTRYSKWDDK